jgi:hypothetical protein
MEIEGDVNVHTFEVRHGNDYTWIYVVASYIDPLSLTQNCTETFIC